MLLIKLCTCGFLSRALFLISLVIMIMHSIGFARILQYILIICITIKGEIKVVKKPYNFLVHVNHNNHEKLLTEQLKYVQENTFIIIG